MLFQSSAAVTTARFRIFPSFQKPHSVFTNNFTYTHTPESLAKCMNGSGARMIGNQHFYTHMHARTHAHTQRYIHNIHMHTHTNTYRHACTHRDLYTHIYTRTHTKTHSHSIFSQSLEIGEEFPFQQLKGYSLEFPLS